MKRVFVLTAFLIAIVLAVAGVVTYIVTRPPVLTPLAVKDGSTVGAILWNETTGSNQTDLILDFAAMTYGNETDGTASTLGLRLHTETIFDSGCACVQINIYATAVGSFASGLRPANVQLWANQTGPNGSLDSWPSEQYGTNVSFDPGQYLGFYNGSGVLLAAITSGSGPAYRFSYSDRFEFNGRPEYNRFVGIRATVTGPFAPIVNVGILLKVINTNGGTWA